MRVLRGHKKAVTGVAFLPGGRLVTGGADGDVCVFDIHGGSRQVVAAGQGAVRCVAASPDGERLVWCADAVPWISIAWAVADAGVTRLGIGDSTSGSAHAMACAFAPDGGTLAAAGCGLALWRLGSGQRVAWVRQDCGSWATDVGLAFTPDSLSVASTGPHTSAGRGRSWGVYFWDAGSGASRPAFPDGQPFAGAQSALAYSPDGQLLAGVHPYLHLLCVCDSTSAEIVHRMQATEPLHGLAFSPCGRRLAVGGNAGLVTLRDTSSWAVVACYDWKLGGVRSLAYSPDGLMLAAGGARGKVVVWDAEV